MIMYEDDFELNKRKSKNTIAEGTASRTAKNSTATRRNGTAARNNGAAGRSNVASGSTTRRNTTSSGSTTGRSNVASGSTTRRNTTTGGSTAGRSNVASGSTTRRNTTTSGSIAGKTNAVGGSATRRNTTSSGSTTRRSTVAGGSTTRRTGAGTTGSNRTRSSASNSNRSSAQNKARSSHEMDLRRKRNKMVKSRNMVLLIGISLIAIFLIIGVTYAVIKLKADTGNQSAKNNTTVTDTASNNSDSSNDSSGNSGGDGAAAVTAEPTATPTPTVEPTEAKIFACGDDLIHAGVYNSGLQDDGTHDYTFLYDNIASYLEEADLKVINQETILGGDDLGLQSYPLFNSPTAIGDALAEVGFNVVLHASNHAYDMGIDGLLNCVSFWRTNHPDVTMLGIHESADEQDEITVVEINGISFALLNYTYSHNWETFSTAAEGHLDMLCAYDEDTREIDYDTINPKVISDIEKAEELADFTIVFPHWGTEYVTSATDQEVNFAKLMTEAGADLIIGTHPHVIQQVEWVSADNGNKALCYYSLGNFTSTQDKWEALMGGLASLTVKKDDTGVYIDEDSIKAIPIVTQYKYPGYNGGAIVTGNYLLKDYTDEQAAAHGVTPRFGVTVSRDKMVELAQSVFGDYFSWE
jgi:poly-gamma-glutamate synthesis protein (capsule biosynthesis protein)